MKLLTRNCAHCSDQFRIAILDWPQSNRHTLPDNWDPRNDFSMYPWEVTPEDMSECQGCYAARQETRDIVIPH